MVCIHLDANYIFCEPMKNRTEGEMINAYQKIVHRMEVSGLGLKHHRLDNECIENFKKCIRKNNMTHELVPPDCHRRNMAERAIQTFKNHFVTATKLASWKIEATALPGLHFFAYMQPGKAFMVVGHTLSTIYSTTMDVATYHGKVVLFTGDWTGTCKCIPILLPPLIAFAWKKCLVVDNKTKLGAWYANNPLEYGKLWDPTAQDGTLAKLHIP
jgi:hypothetical protein